MSLRIPQKAQRILLDLFYLDKSRQDELIVTLNSFNVNENFSSYKEKISEIFPEKEVDWHEDLLKALISFSMLPDKQRSFSKVTNDIVESFEKTVDFKERTGKRIANLKEFISQLLGSHDTLSLSLRARAYNIAIEHESIYLEANVFSDVRVVPSQSSSQLIASIITHSLKLKTRTHGEERSYYITLDRDDLGKLRDILEDALERHSLLENTTSQLQGIQYIDINSGDE